jgi:hypothetical protein
LAFVRLRTLSEAEAYARCYGEGDENVRSIRVGPRRPRLFFGVTGEDLRQAFETRLLGREPAHDELADPLVEVVPGSIAGGASNGHKPAAAA